jgi:hypothetical protein
MSDPKRLIEVESGLTGVLLSSANGDGPCAESKARAAQALGIVTLATAGATMGAGAGIAHATATTAAAAGKGSFFGAVFGGVTTSKWLLVAALGGGSALGVHYGVGATEAEIEEVVARPSNAAAASSAVLSEPVMPLQPDPLQNVEQEPVVVQAEIEQASAPKAEPVLRSKARERPARKATSPAPGIADELVLIERARSQAVESSLVTLEQYFLRFPRGILLPEARALQIEAALALGDRAGALQTFEELESSHPRSPLLRRLRLSLALDEPQEL